MKTTSINNTYGEYLSIIEQNYKRLYALVTQLLDFRKVDSGSYKFSYDSYLVKGTVTKITNIFELSIRQKKINIDISSIPESMTIVTDEEAFTKIISNLLSNALKYAKSIINITAIENNSEIIITVTDDGIGITDQEKKKIFNAFYQVKDNNELNKLGIGIGLHMTRSLIQLMNGRIEVKDREDGRSGVSISVYFPKQTAINPSQQTTKRMEDTITVETNVAEGDSVTILQDKLIKSNIL